MQSQNYTKLLNFILVEGSRVMHNKDEKRKKSQIRTHKLGL